MKDLFKAFYRLTEEEYKELWQTALFVPDTSFLCNLYRLPATSRKEMFKALTTVSDRLWIPHHVVLEFFRNRLKVIADQKNKFSEVKNLINEFYIEFTSKLSKLKLKKRHSLINPDSFEKKLKELITSFNKEISELEKKQITVANDPILEDLTALIDDKIGTHPDNQKEIDEIYQEAKSRFTNKIPPGYKDTDKAKDIPNHQYGGIVYQRQYGDYLIWKQLLNEATNRNKKAVILLSDDFKEDWIWSVSGKKLGPRPELTEEIYRIAGTKLFHIYNTENFLKFADQYFDIEISAESIKAVKDIADVTREEADPLFIAANDPTSIVEEIIHELGPELVNSDETVTGAMAITNAYVWGLDDYSILDIEYDEKEQTIDFEANITLSGEQDEDRPFSGDALELTISGTIEYTGDSFQLSDYNIISCESNI